MRRLSWLRAVPCSARLSTVLITSVLSLASCSDAGGPKLPTGSPVAVSQPAPNAPPVVNALSPVAPETPPSQIVAPTGPVASPEPTPPAGTPPAPIVQVAKPVEPPVAPPVANTPVVNGPVSVHARLSGSHVLMPGDGTVAVVIELTGAAKPEVLTRLPLNLSLVIDRSGSMRGEKMTETREAARKLVEQLSDKDTLSIVSYSDDVRVDVPAGRLTDEHRKFALDAITSMQPGGSTNLSGGLIRGQEEVARNVAAGQVNRVILMSDGLANRGITDTEAVARAAQREAQRGVSVTTIGVGTDYNEDLMTAVADRASGNYYFVANANAIPGVLSGELTKMMSTVAQNAQVEFEIEDGVELAQVFGYTFTRQGDKVTVPLAELFAGQHRSVALRLTVPVLREGTVRVGNAVVTYSDPQKSGGSITVRLPLDVVVTKDATLVEKGRDRSVEERLVEVKTAAIVNEAANLVRDGRAGAATVLLQANQRELETQAKAMGGSARISAQAANLGSVNRLFEEAAAPAAAPAAAAEAVKRTKAESFDLAR